MLWVSSRASGWPPPLHFHQFGHVGAQLLEARPWMRLRISWKGEADEMLVEVVGCAD